MANSNVIASMLRVVEDYETRRISPEAVENSLESQMQTIERTRPLGVHQNKGIDAQTGCTEGRDRVSVGHRTWLNRRR